MQISYHFFYTLSIAKRKIVDAITKVLLDMGVLVERINVIIKDNPKHNWAVAATKMMGAGGEND